VTPADPEQLANLFENAVRQLAEAEAADLVPLRRALETASTDPTPEKLQALLDQLTTIQEQLGTRSEEVRANILGTSLVTGLTS
jgi:ABC-type transporter Mla subunit MlaD